MAIRSGEKVYCYCPTCDYGLELEEGQRCGDFRCLCCGRPLHPDIRIAQQKAPRGPGRRREEEEEGKIVPGWWPNGWEPKPPLLPPTLKKCRCPHCNYEIVVEEGARCLNSVCPLCGHRMVDE